MNVLCETQNSKPELIVHFVWEDHMYIPELSNHVLCDINHYYKPSSLKVITPCECILNLQSSNGKFICLYVPYKVYAYKSARTVNVLGKHMPVKSTHVLVLKTPSLCLSPRTSCAFTVLDSKQHESTNGACFFWEMQANNMLLTHCAHLLRCMPVTQHSWCICCEVSWLQPSSLYECTVLK